MKRSYKVTISVEIGQNLPSSNFRSLLVIWIQNHACAFEKGLTAPWTPMDKMRYIRAENKPDDLPVHQWMAHQESKQALSIRLSRPFATRCRNVVFRKVVYTEKNKKIYIVSNTRHFRLGYTPLDSINDIKFNSLVKTMVIMSLIRIITSQDKR